MRRSTVIHVRDAHETDFAAIAALDLTYESSRVLAIERTGTAPELTIGLRWRPHEPIVLTYTQYPEERQAGDAVGAAGGRRRMLAVGR